MRRALDGLVDGLRRLPPRYRGQQDEFFADVAESMQVRAFEEAEQRYSELAYAHRGSQGFSPAGARAERRAVPSST